MKFNHREEFRAKFGDVVDFVEKNGNDSWWFKPNWYSKPIYVSGDRILACKNGDEFLELLETEAAIEEMI